MKSIFTHYSNNSSLFPCLWPYIGFRFCISISTAYPLRLSFSPLLPVAILQAFLEQSRVFDYPSLIYVSAQIRGRSKKLPAQVFFKLSDRRLPLIWLCMIWLITLKSRQISPGLYHYQLLLTVCDHECSLCTSTTWLSQKGVTCFTHR